jgi:RNA polymerase sigma-70 factor (sigma-E family)
MAGIADEDGFAEYAASALPRLRRIAFLLCQDWHRADDLTQSALTRLYLHWRRAKAADNLDAYLGAILMNVFLSEQRTSWWKRTSVRSEPAAAADTPWAGGAGAPGGGTDQVEDQLDLRAALHLLAPRRRAVVVLRYYCDYSVEQTALLLHCSTGTVKSQTSRGLAQLRDVLESRGPDTGHTDEGDKPATPPPPSPPETSFRMGSTRPGRTQ